ncbi:MAG: fumarate hydratase [bacterium]
MIKINSETIKKTVYDLCFQANIYTSKDVYNALLNAYKTETSEKAKNVIGEILQNIQLSAISQRPLCQDTGFVTVFVEIGNNIFIEGQSITDAINDAVSQCYTENFFRKSMVSNPIFERKNTNDNTPAIIHTEIVTGNEINIKVAIKGCGSENMSQIKMLKPSDGIEGIIDFAVNTVKEAGSRPCPPIRLGLGIGGTFDKSAVLAKKSLSLPVQTEEDLKNNNDDISKLELGIMQKCNELKIGAAGLGGNNTVFGVNILTHPTHIAAMPVAININCHSSRHSEATISENGVKYHTDELQTEFENIEINNNYEKRINTDEIEKIRNLSAGESVLLSGKIITARDAAHKKIVEIIQAGKNLPFELKDKIIYYVGPCPAKDNEIIGPCGPTTSSRMDKYMPVILKNGMLACIGKGSRDNQVKEELKQYKGLYFITTGGVANLLKEKVKASKIIAFEELGPEAVYELEIKDFPITVAIDADGNNFIR